MIRSRVVRGSDGRTWTIRRRWAHRPRWRGPFGRRLLDLADVGFDFDLEGILIVIAIAALVVFMIFVGVPLLIFLFESLLLIPVFLVVGVLGRVFFRRPWTLEATADPALDWPHRIEWKVVGWGASSRAAAAMAGIIRSTGELPAQPPASIAGPRAHRRLPR